MPGSMDEEDDRDTKAKPTTLTVTSTSHSLLYVGLVRGCWWLPAFGDFFELMQMVQAFGLLSKEGL